MIINSCNRDEYSDKKIMDIIGQAINENKCVEIYTKSIDLIYAYKNKDNKILYGYYNKCEEDHFTARTFDCYTYNMTIEFTSEDELCRTTRCFDISDLYKVSIANDWSN